MTSGSSVFSLRRGRFPFSTTRTSLRFSTSAARRASTTSPPTGRREKTARANWRQPENKKRFGYYHPVLRSSHRRTSGGYYSPRHQAGKHYAAPGRLREDSRFRAGKTNAVNSQAAFGDLAKTAKGVIIGTPAYMSPEQSAATWFDPRADYGASALFCMSWRRESSVQKETGERLFRRF